MGKYEDLIKRLREEMECPDNFPEDSNLMREAADAIEELSKKENTTQWIPVTERLPEQEKQYLVIRFDEDTKMQFIDILWHDAHDLWWNRLYNVTHWMPLPSPEGFNET